MGLLDIFKRQGAAGAAAAAGEPVELARSRARRRLIGAVVLLGVGVVAFPLLFETQPRPIPVDIPIEIPSRDSPAPLALPPPKVVANAGSAPVAPPATKAPVAAPVPASTLEPRPDPPKADVPPKDAPAKPATTAQTSPAPKPAPEPAKPVAEPAGRFVVQVGAFAEASAVREARAKVEKLGLASYTQVVETSSGSRTRVRLGPFGTRDEAEKAAAKLKAAGLPGAVLTL
jgi:DedD protein